MHGQRGYVLILVTVTLAMLAALAGRFATRVDDVLRQTALLRDEVAGDVAAAGARAESLYTLLTQPSNPMGFGTPGVKQWPADGRWLRASSGAAVRLQDARGLLSLNAVDREPLFRLLVEAGAEPGQVPRLIDSLEDYTDIDSLRRLNGAEAPQYRELGMPGPRNDWMLSNRELCQIPAWQEQGDLCARVAAWVSTRRSPEVNPNTAPAPVLRALVPQALPGQIEQVILRRGIAGFSSVPEAEVASGLQLQAIEPALWVGLHFVLRIWAEGQPRATEYNVLLTPEAAKAPWSIVELHRVAKPVPADLPPRPSVLSPPADPSRVVLSVQAPAGLGITAQRGPP